MCGPRGGQAKIASGWPPGFDGLSGHSLTPGGPMSATASASVCIAALAASTASRRRSVPPSLSVPVSQSLNQRWRERPRCPALASGPRPSRRGRSRHRWSCRMSLSARTGRARRTRRPRARVRVQIRRNEAADESHRNRLARVPMFSRKERRFCGSRSRCRTIAHFMLAPCSASSMLFASLRPGRRPGLRALTTPARGTTWAIARWPAF